MKELLAVIPLLLSGVLAEAPYAPSGFRPNGPAFELPQKTQNPQQQYLPPVDPRIPSTKYGFPEEDVSVQGLPSLDQRPIFMVSPINGQQYVGPEFNKDIKSLDDSYRQSQYQQQQEEYREFERQRQLEVAQARTRANQVPRQFVPDRVSTTEATTKNADDFRTTESTSSTTESDLNEGETLDDKRDDKKGKVTVEVSRQNIQEYPGELFLSGLAQLQLQPQFVPFGQIRAPLYFQPIQQEPSQKQVSSYDAATHFAALPSILAQQQYLQGVQAQGFVNPAFQQQVVVSGQDPNVGFVAQSPQPIGNQYQPAVAAQNPQVFKQYQPQSIPKSGVQPQNVQPQSKAEDDDEQKDDQEQPQFVYQQSYQPQEVIYQAPAPQQVETQYQAQQGFQPQGVYQAPLAQAPANQYPQQGFQPQGVIYQAPQQAPASQYQPQEQQNVFLQAPQAQYQPQEQPTFLPQAQLVSYQQPIIQQYQSGFTPQYQNGLVPQQLSNQQFPQQVNQAPDALQSGLDVNQQGNGVEQPEDQDTEERNSQDDGATSVAVATAFGTRTQPRVFTRYGAPVPVPRGAANPQATTESAVDEQATEDTGAVAEANAFAGRRKSAKLRSRRVRPIFTLDRSGHLVLVQEQN